MKSVGGTRVHVSRRGSIDISGARGVVSGRNSSPLRVPVTSVWSAIRDATSSPMPRRRSLAARPSALGSSSPSSLPPAAARSSSASPDRSDRAAYLAALADLADARRTIVSEWTLRETAEARAGDAERALRAELSSAHAEAAALRGVIERLRQTSYETKVNYVTKGTATMLREQSLNTARAEFEAEIESTVSAMRAEFAATLREMIAERNLHLTRTVADVKVREGDRLERERESWMRSTASRVERAEALRADAQVEADAARAAIETQRTLAEAESDAALSDLEALWRRKATVLAERLARSEAARADPLNVAAIEEAEDERFALADRAERAELAAAAEANEARETHAIALAAAEARHTHELRSAKSAHAAEMRSQWHVTSEATIAAAQQAVERYRSEVGSVEAEAHRAQIAEMRSEVQQSRREAYQTGVQLGEATSTLARLASASPPSSSSSSSSSSLPLAILPPPSAVRPDVLNVGRIVLPPSPSRQAALSAGKSLSRVSGTIPDGERTTLHVNRNGVISLR